MTSASEAERKAVAFLGDLIERAHTAGADAADAVLFDGTSLSVSQRLGEREDLDRAESADFGLRVFIGQRQAIVSSTDKSEEAIGELVTRAIAMARAASEDPHCGLADSKLLAQMLPALELRDDFEPDAEHLYGRAGVAENAARAVPGITNSEGASATWSRTTVSLVNSDGFAGAHTATRHGLMVSVLAGEGTAMESDYEYHSARFEADLDDPASLGRRAGERTVKRLNPRKAGTAQVPVVYDPRVAGGLLRHFAGAISGSSVARRTSFLRDRMDEPVFAPGINVIDDPHRMRGLSSRPFDGEGVATARRAVIEDGALRTWLLDAASAHQLGLPSTGHASRGTSAPPSPSSSNLYLEAGRATPAELMADIKSGFYITSLMGMGANPVTGDYSRGATGFWIENGEITYPVSELTVAGNLKDMYRALTPANDLEFRHGTDSPTVRIEGMTVAGA
jgi:PmbA protein